MDNKIKSNGENYQPVKVRVKINRMKIVKTAFGLLTVACVVLGVLMLCGY